MNKFALAAFSTLISSGVAVLVVQELWERDQSASVLVVDTTAELMSALDRTNQAPIAAETTASAGGTESIANAPLPPPVHLQPMHETALRAFFPATERKHYREDPLSYVAYRPNLRFKRVLEEHPDKSFLIRVNSDGLRETKQVRSDRPGLRILITGDSHIAGVVPHRENVSAVLRRTLNAADPAADVETLNAGLGSFTVYNYLGVLERYAYLKPDVFVVVVYGGNDFRGVARMERYFTGRGRYSIRKIPDGKRREAWAATGSVRSQETNQTYYMLFNEGDASVAAETSGSILDEIAERCEKRGIVPIFAYLPPALAAQPHEFERELELTATALDIDTDEVAVSDTIADEMIRALQDRGRTIIDLRPAFRASKELLYWRSDFHINTAGHQLLAEILAPVVQEASAARH